MDEDFHNIQIVTSLQNIPLNEKKDKLDEMRDVLIFLQEEDGMVRKTREVYQSNISFQLLSEYLAELKEKKLIVETTKGRDRIWMPTQKGYDYIKNYGVIKEFISSFGLD